MTKCPARNSGMGLIFQNLVNIKGLSAGQNGIPSKDKPVKPVQVFRAGYLVADAGFRFAIFVHQKIFHEPFTARGAYLAKADAFDAVLFAPLLDLQVKFVFGCTPGTVGIKHVGAVVAGCKCFAPRFGTLRHKCSKGDKSRTKDGG